MRTKTLVLLSLLALAGGCVSAGQYFGKRANRLVAWGDRVLQRDARYAPRVVREYSGFLAKLPSHPSLDGIRVRMYEKRAEAYRAMNRGDLAERDRKAAAEVRARSPFFTGRRKPARAGEGAETAAPPREDAAGPAREREPGAVPWKSPEPVKKRPTSHLDVALGVAYLNRRALRSDSRAHPDVALDLEDDLDLGLTTGFPEITLRLQPRDGKALFGVDLWTAAFTGETTASAPIHYDGWSAQTGEQVRTRFTYTSVAAFLGFIPSAKLLGKVDIELGLKHVYVQTRLHGSTSGRHVDALHVPLLFPGVRVHHRIGNRFSLEGRLRIGAMLWSASSFTAGAFCFDAGLGARFKLNEKVSLGVGAELEYLTFTESKSGDRSKRANLGHGGGYLEAAFKF